MEELMYYVWQQRMFQSLELLDATPVEVLNPGLRNLDAGPDFFNAKVKIDGMTWAGNIEMHVKASDWMRHHHQHNPAYDSVILHVVLQADAEVRLATTGETIRTVVMHIPPEVLVKYRQLTASEKMIIRLPGSSLPYYTAINCAPRLPLVPKLVTDDWIQALAIQRMLAKMQRVSDLVEGRKDSWAEAFYVMLCRSLGTGVNSDACERLARSLPLHALQKHLDSRLQVEAMLFGQAGWLSDEGNTGGTIVIPRPDKGVMADATCSYELSYLQQLRREYAFLRAKFQLSPLAASVWQFGRVRPKASPHFRMAYLAALLCSQHDLFGRIVDAGSLQELFSIFNVCVEGYWSTHYHLGGDVSRDDIHGIGLQTLRSIIINAVVPVLLAYYRWMGDEERMERALGLLSLLPAEDNRYMAQWIAAGLPLRNAMDTQALLHLYREYCEPHKCMQCRIGCWMMRN